MDTKKKLVLNNVHLKIQLQRLRKKEEELKQKVDSAAAENFRLREQVIDDEQRIFALIEKDIDYYAGEITKLEASRPYAIKEELESRIHGLEIMIEEKRRRRKFNLLGWAGYILAFLAGAGVVWVL